jgi:hypothetical protein
VLIHRIFAPMRQAWLSVRQWWRPSLDSSSMNGTAIEMPAAPVPIIATPPVGDHRKDVEEAGRERIDTHLKSDMHKRKAS